MYRFQNIDYFISNSHGNYISIFRTLIFAKNHVWYDILCNKQLCSKCDIFFYLTIISVNFNFFVFNFHFENAKLQIKEKEKNKKKKQAFQLHQRTNKHTSFLYIRNFLINKQSSDNKTDRITYIQRDFRDQDIFCLLREENGIQLQSFK